MYTSRKSALGALVVMLAALGAVTPAIGQQGTIAANTITEGRLEQGDTRRDGGFVDNYRYDGEAGEELHIVLSPNMPIGRRVTIEGPGGLSAGSNSGQSDSLDVRLPQRGRGVAPASPGATGGCE